MTRTPTLSYWPDSQNFFLEPSQPMVEEFGARAFNPWPGDFENYDIFNARSQEFAWPEMTENEFRSFLMFVAHNLHIHDNEKMTIRGWTFAALVAMEGADNIGPERVAEMMRELQRACR